MAHWTYYNPVDMLYDPPINVGATNESGFTGLPGGVSKEGLEDRYFFGVRGYWWSIDPEDIIYDPKFRLLRIESSSIIIAAASGGQERFSVRCVKDQ